MFTVGQKVICKVHGEGVVDSVDAGGVYPVKVEFPNGQCNHYTVDGKLYEDDDEPSLSVIEGDAMFTVGQRVWCVIFGEGAVAEITCGLYPVEVRFENGEMVPYTSKGNLSSRGNRALFHHPVKIVQDESATKPSINWEHVSSEFNYLAEDADGVVFLYEDKPFTAMETWMVDNGDLAEAHTLASYTKGTCDWKESLIERPKN